MSKAMKLLRGAAFALCLSGGAALAGDISVSAPWTRATAKGASVGVGYLSIANKGRAPDRLVSAATEGAESVELHASSIEDGVMKMRALPDGVEIAPGETLVFRPNGLHLMLVGLKKPLQQGGSLRVTLTFARAGAVAVDLPVQALGASGPPAAEDSPTISY